MSSLLKKGATFLGAASLLVIAGAGAADKDLTRNPETGRTCFHIRDVQGYSPAKVGARDGVNLRMADRNVFQLEFIAPCPDAKTASRVKLKSNSVTDYVCSGADTSLVAYQESGETQQCVVSGMRKLTREQISALEENEIP